jgi:hypothetical protein
MKWLRPAQIILLSIVCTSTQVCRVCFAENNQSALNRLNKAGGVSSSSRAASCGSPSMTRRVALNGGRLLRVSSPAPANLEVDSDAGFTGVTFEDLIWWFGDDGTPSEEFYPSSTTFEYLRDGHYPGDGIYTWTINDQLVAGGGEVADFSFSSDTAGLPVRTTTREDDSTVVIYAHGASISSPGTTISVTFTSSCGVTETASTGAYVDSPYKLVSPTSKYYAWNSTCSIYATATAATYHYGFANVAISTLQSRMLGTDMAYVYESEALWGVTDSPAGSNWDAYYGKPTTTPAPTTGPLVGDLLSACGSELKPQPYPWNGSLAALEYQDSQQVCIQGTNAASPIYGVVGCGRNGAAVPVQDDTQNLYVDEGTVSAVKSPIPKPPI